MDRFFDWIGDVVRSIMNSRGSDPGTHARPAAAAGADPDLREAWEELDRYLAGDERVRPQPGRPPDPALEALRQDYANLEVPFGAPFDEVRRSYRRLLAAYHPDRNAGDPEKLRLATEITKKINISYRRIEELEEKRGR